MHHALKILASLAAVAALAGCGSSHPGTSSSASTTTARTSVPGAPPRLVGRIAAVPGTRATVATLAHFAHPPRAPHQAHLAGLEGLSLPQKLGVLVPQSARLWQVLFSHAGALLPAANEYLIEPGQTARCADATITSGSPPEYCPADASIYLPAGFLHTNIEPLGDAALLLIVSDLYGLHVENALGVLASFTPAQVELTDACLAGIEFTYANYRHQLEPADEQSVNQLLAAEAPVAGQHARGVVTSAALTTAFNRGLLSNFSFRSCLPAK